VWGQSSKVEVSRHHILNQLKAINKIGWITSQCTITVVLMAEQLMALLILNVD
jgi:hypothetical protein